MPRWPSIEWSSLRRAPAVAREFQQKARATQRTGVQRGCAAVQFGLLRDKRQPQPGARARCRRPAGEACEDRSALRFRDPGAVVVDRDFHAFAGTRYVELDFGGTAVLDRIG